uniref:CACN subunit beta associated regulatory protein n=1 Tax=Amphiprion percula TaxID=161767 RepID=A0A3P8SH86_AMPPE
MISLCPLVPQEILFEAEEQQDGYVLLLVILSIFLVGTLIFISVFLIACRRSCRGGQCCARCDIGIMVDESDCLSMASSHDQETERFLSTGPTGRRVSFNEAALFDHGKKAQEKGRRYTLTEGDFHHLKNARLTHLHITPPALKIVTIHECDSAENTITATTRPVAKSALSIFQVTAATSLTSLSVNPSGALPGDTLNSVVDTSSSVSVGEGAAVGSAASPAGGASGSQRPVLQFLTKLRRHASLEGASPYFKIKKWKLDSSQRASSLDTRGSPKRRQFQRQRAASESMDQDDNDAHHIDLIQYIARTQDVAYRPSQPTTRLLSPPSTPPPSLGREGTNPLDPLDPQDPQSLYRDIWSLRATLEQYAASDQSSNNDRNSVCSDADSVCSLGGKESIKRKQGRTRKLLQMDSGYASIEAPCRGPEDLRLFGKAVQPPPAPLTLHRRDYSIDEKTDALFHEFLRHDPQFDQQESPLKKHRSRVHLRKQWQRHKQWSDPGVRHFQSSFERQRTPLRRGDSVNYPLDTSYHSTLPRIVSAPDEETSDGTGSTPDTPKLEPTEDVGKDKEQEDHTSSSPPTLPTSISEKDGVLVEQPDPQEDSKQSGHPPDPLDERSPPQLPDSSGYGPQTITAEITDKLTANLDERLYTGLRRTKETATECVMVTATHASPDHSPV